MSEPNPRVLVADDQADVLEALRLLLKGEGYAIETAASPAGILAALETREFDVLLMDLNYARDTTSGKEGLDLLSRIQGLDPVLPVVVMTAWGCRFTLLSSRRSMSRPSGSASGRDGEATEPARPENEEVGGGGGTPPMGRCPGVPSGHRRPGFPIAEGWVRRHQRAYDPIKDDPRVDPRTGRGGRGGGHPGRALAGAGAVVAG